MNKEAAIAMKLRIYVFEVARFSANSKPNIVNFTPVMVADDLKDVLARYPRCVLPGEVIPVGRGLVAYNLAEKE